MTGTFSPRVAIIGAGLVGCATALELTSRGAVVTVFDEGAPASGASFGNAGAIVTGAVTPTATPAVLRGMAGYLFDRKSPAVLRLHHALRVMPWLIRFVKAGRLAEVERIAAALTPLVRDSLNAHQRLAAKAGSQAFIGSEGWLKVYPSDEAFAATTLDRRLMAQARVPFDILGPSALRELEPNIAPEAMRHGIFQHQSGFVRDPKGMATAWMTAALHMGAQHLRQRVRAVTPTPQGVCITTEAGARDFDRLILCAGAWSAKLAATWGEVISLETERGYHLAFSEAASSLLRGPVVFPSQGFVLSPMAGGLRLVSGDELAGLTAPPNYTRIRRLIPDARSVLPALAHEQVTREWMGHRPSTPDSMPVIGRSVKHPHIFHAFGHGHIGLTLSAITAELVSDAVEERPSPIKIDYFSSARFV